MSYSQARMINKLKQLPRDRKIKISSSQNTAWMVCQWHYTSSREREKTPSFLINLKRNGRYKPGTGRCFGCGKFIKNFETIIDPSKESISDSLGEDADEYAEPLYNNTLNALLYDEDEAPISLPNALPWTRNENWRSIKGQLMYLIGAQQIYEEDFEKIMAYLPCFVHKEHVGGIKANLQKEGKRNYINTDGAWVKNQGLFPYDFTVKYLNKYVLSTIVLVEGPRDALRCLQLGIPALAILGTQNWSENKAELISSINPKRVITAMDPDKAGYLATNAVHESFKGELDVYNFRFDKYALDIDPGNAPKDIMKKLRSFVI